MAKKMKLTLYHADWCGHCTEFLPAWTKFESTFNGKLNGNLQINNVESKQMPPDASVAGQPIEGFPTVKIEYNNTEFEYKGKRSYEGLKDFVSQRLNINL